MHFIFENESYGEIKLDEGSKYEFIKVNEDEWKRPSTFDGSTYTYTLTRIVNANGEPNPKHWPAWKKHMGWFFGYRKLRVWANDNECQRKCEAAQMKRLAPQSLACWLCKD